MEAHSGICHQGFLRRGYQSFSPLPVRNPSRMATATHSPTERAREAQSGVTAPGLEALREEDRLAVQRLLSFLGVAALELAVGLERPAVRGVGELEVEEAADLLAVAPLAQGEGGLHAAVEVALHQVSAAEVDRLLVGAEGEDAGVLQEAAHQGDDADVLAHALDAGPQAADAAHDQVYLHPGLGGLVEHLDDPRVGERVRLARYPRRLPVSGLLGLLLDAAHDALAQGHGGDEELLVLLVLGVAGEVVEEVGAVLGQLLVVGEVGEVRVDAGGAGVVVAGAEVEVAPQAVPLAADHEADLGVRLEADDAVGDVHAPRLELPRPRYVRLLVEAGLQLDQGGDLRLLVAGLGEGLDYGRVRPDPVEGLLYGEHLGVVRGGPDKVHDRGERVEGVVEEDVAVADGLGDRPRVPDLRRHPRRDGRGEQVPAVEVRELLQIRQPYGVGCREHGVLAQLEVAGEPLHEVFWHVVGDHEPDALAEPAPLELVLYGLQEVRGLVLLYDEVRVARYLEDVARGDVLPGEELVEVRRDDLLDPHEPELRPPVGTRIRLRQPHEAVYGRRHLYPRHDPAPLVLYDDEQVEGEVRDVGEGVGGIYRERRQDRQYVSDKVFPERPLLGGPHLLVRDHLDALLRQGGEKVPVEYGPPLLEELVGTPLDAGELLLGGQTVGNGVRQLRGHLLLEPRHPDHEELVEVGLRDGDEAHPLQQRVALVAGLLQHPVVEPEPGELAVDVQLRVREAGLARDVGHISPLSASASRVPSLIPPRATLSSSFP